MDLDFSLQGKVAVVTGGASGIGRAIVDAFTAKGATAVVADRTVEASAGDERPAAAVACDVTDPASVDRAVTTVERRYGRIDVLVNSAGLALLAPAEELSLPQWDLTMSVNLTGAIFVNQSAAFSDFHVTGANPAGNASLTDTAFVATRFRRVMWRRPAAVTV